jgi:hypothetical protein
VRRAISFNVRKRSDGDFAGEPVLGFGQDSSAIEIIVSISSVVTTRGGAKVHDFAGDARDEAALPKTIGGPLRELRILAPFRPGGFIGVT